MANCGVTWAVFYGSLELMADMNDSLALPVEEFGAVVRHGCGEAVRRVTAWPGDNPVVLFAVAWWGNTTIYEERFECGTDLEKGDAAEEVRRAFTLLLQRLARAAAAPPAGEEGGESAPVAAVPADPD